MRRGKVKKNLNFNENDSQEMLELELCEIVQWIMEDIQKNKES